MEDVWKRKYLAYIKTAQWRNTRDLMIRLAGNICQRCGASSATLEVHHKTYDRLGKENKDDLEVLCKECHKIADSERARIGKAKSAKAKYNAGLETFMSKKYGDDWADNDHDPSEYDEWLEIKNDEC